jgi:3,4-dihydroxy-9,10-secoandrosta-1,3,5(10)-triene-9,17-dione 4,5-dioxygenase
MGVHSLAYVVVEATDVEAWRAFGCDVLGMQEARADDGALLLRIDERPFRFRVQPGARDAVLASGLEFANGEAFEAGLARLQSAGVQVTRADDSSARGRQVRGLAQCADPAGNPLELVWGNPVTGDPFRSPTGVSRFVTGDGGMGHIVFGTPLFAETCSFYRDLLGFGTSDEMLFRFPGDQDREYGLAFLHGDGTRHHVVAVGEFSVPGGVVHAMVEVSSLDEVGMALDRAMAAGHHITTTLGRHTNDRMISFYVQSPSGFSIEYGYDGLQCTDWSRFSPTFTTKENLWGHRLDLGA